MSGRTLTGTEVIEALAGKDLNQDGQIINLIICGNSKFYDYSFFEEESSNAISQSNKVVDAK